MNEKCFLVHSRFPDKKYKWSFFVLLLYSKSQRSGVLIFQYIVNCLHLVMTNSISFVINACVCDYFHKQNLFKNVIVLTISILNGFQFFSPLIYLVRQSIILLFTYCCFYVFFNCLIIYSFVMDY